MLYILKIQLMSQACVFFTYLDLNQPPMSNHTHYQQCLSAQLVVGEVLPHTQVILEHSLLKTVE